jgi:hypothetical protein
MVRPNTIQFTFSLVAGCSEWCSAQSTASVSLVNLATRPALAGQLFAPRHVRETGTFHSNDELAIRSDYREKIQAYKEKERFENTPTARSTRPIHHNVKIEKRHRNTGWHRTADGAPTDAASHERLLRSLAQNDDEPQCPPQTQCKTVPCIPSSIESIPQTLMSTCGN